MPYDSSINIIIHACVCSCSVFYTISSLYFIMRLCMQMLLYEWVYTQCSPRDISTVFIRSRHIIIRPSKKLLRCSRTKLRLSSAMVCPERASVFHMRSWPHPLNRVRACVRLLFEGGYYFFHWAPWRCGYYSMCGFGISSWDNIVQSECLRKLWVYSIIADI